MLRKTVLMLAAGFIFQFMMSCDRNCNPGPTIAMVYTDVTLGAYSEIDDELTPVKGSVHKENFRLRIAFAKQEDQSAQVSESLSFGYNTAIALDCGPYYIYPDKVKELSILMINTEDSSEEKDVTDLFALKTESKTYTVKDLIERQSDEERGHNLFNLSLLEYDSIYKNASFQVTTTLESGKRFTQETEEIIFIG